MDLRDTKADASFRDQVRTWIGENLVGDFAEAGDIGGPGREHQGFEIRLAWEQLLGEAGWTCLGWPTEWGGRGASIAQQVIWNEEYVRASCPARIGIVGEGLLGPTLIAYGSEEQKQRFLKPIALGQQFWCQGYSEPDAGSDLANVRTSAVLDGDEWVINGQKIWTSLAQWADWCFVLARTERDSSRHKGLSYLLVPMKQPGIELRPITQLTGTSEFNEVFFDNARTSRDLVVGEVGEGWRVGLATLAFERGVALLGHQLRFRRELEQVIDEARINGTSSDPVMRQRLARSWETLAILRLNILRSLPGLEGPLSTPEASIAKLFWGTWHRDLGELAMDVMGMKSTVCKDSPYDLSDLQSLFLFSRADTIYGGSNQIQRNIVAERVLGLPPEPKGSK
jgi:alkylation response protein AidB-like acyl-CoA dehydrogenase